MSARSRHRLVTITMILLLAPAATGADLEDPYLGEALYFAYQERYFDALKRLDVEIAQHQGVDEPKLDALYAYIDHAEFSVGDFELRYRMHQRAGRAIRAVLEGDVREPVRNDAAYRLARIHFQKGQPHEALSVLERIRGRVPERIHDDVEFLRANVYLALGRPAEAVETLERLQDSERLTGFAGYNLGIALLQDEREADAIEELDRAGKVDARDPAIRAIRDKSNLVLGTLLLESTTPRQAQRYLDRVHLDGPYSNQALLRAGWANASADRFDRAVVPWSLLAEREPTDAAVQDVLLALPHAYSKLDLHGRAAVLYEQAARVFGDELQKIDTSIASIREGRFLEALVQEEVRQDANWVIHLRSRRGAPETFYLTGLMASHEFHTALRNYLDLEDLRNRLVAWRTDLDAFEDLIRLRREYYEPLLPEVDRRFRRLDARIRLRLEQREHLAHRLQQMLTAPQPELLATSEEQLARAELRRLESSFEGASDRDRADIQERIERLKGTLDWTLAIDYHRRLMLAHRHLRELGADVQALDARYERFVRVRQAAVHSYVGYGIPIDGLRTRVREALDRLTTLMARQGHALETLATRELTARRERLEDYQNQARFAFADSYDRAAKAQARHE